MSAKTIDTLILEIKDQAMKDILLRAARAMEFLLGEIKRAYKFKASHGESGALGGLMAEVKKSKDFIEATIGVTRAAKYLANLDQGERGTEGGPEGGAPFKRTKAPPLKNIYQWIRLAAITIPKYYQTRAKAHQKKISASSKLSKRQKKKSFGKFDPSKPWYSTDPQMLFAFDIAIKRKRFGIKGLHIIEKVALAQAQKINSYLSA
ncbi:MAG: hypothetical protein ABI778_12970 [Ignavibacteriota bacterium]